MLLTPIILFVILMILLYVPPVQNFIRKQATAIASDATGMNISVERTIENKLAQAIINNEIKFGSNIFFDIENDDLIIKKIS